MRIAKEEVESFERGIRLQVASQVLAGFLAGRIHNDWEDRYLVTEAVKMADLLIEEVSKQPYQAGSEIEPDRRLLDDPKDSTGL